jgi:hypothetical protein
VEYTEEEKEDMDDISPLGKFDVERWKYLLNLEK